MRLTSLESRRGAAASEAPTIGGGSIRRRSSGKQWENAPAGARTLDKIGNRCERGGAARRRPGAAFAPRSKAKAVTGRSRGLGPATKSGPVAERRVREVSGCRPLLLILFLYTFPAAGNHVRPEAQSCS